MGSMQSAPMDPADVRSEALYSYHTLCGYRYDNSNSGFAKTYNGTLRTCFEDVVLVPLATWVLLALLVIVLVPAILTARKRSSGAVRKTTLQRYGFSARKREQRLLGASTLKGDTSSDLQKTADRHFTTKASGLWTTLAILFQALVVASLLMNILEIVRLALANRGVGLLPFTLAGILIAFVLYHLPLAPSVRPVTNGVLLVFWTLLLVFTSVQLSTLHKLEPVEPRLNTEYHNADQQIDVGVMVGLYAIFVITEFIRLPMSIKEAAQS